MILNRELEVFELGTKIQSQVQSEMEKGQREFFLRQQLKAIQDELGEGDAGAGGDRRAARAARGARAAGGRREGGAARARAARAAAVGGRRVRRHPHVPRLDPHAAVERRRPRTTSTSTHARDDPRRGPLRPREGEGADHRVPRRLEAEARGRRGRSSASSGRPASARRRSASRSRARSGASSRASPSAACATRRRSAGTGARTSARCPGTIIRALRDAESMNPVLLIDEIDKMGADFRGDPGVARCSRCSTRSRTGTSATTTSTCRSTSRRCCSSAPRTRSTRSPGRCSTAWT